MKISLKKFLYVLSAMFILTGRFWKIEISFNIRLLLMGIWVMYLVANILCLKSSSGSIKLLKYHFRMAAAPIIVMIGYAILLWLFEDDISIRNYTRLLSTSLRILFSFGFVSCGYYLFKDKTIDLLFKASVLSYTIGSILCLFVSLGVGEALQYIFSIFTFKPNSIATEIMEVHDITFAFGIFLIYFIFCGDYVKKRNEKIIISIIYIILGYKRIEILAICMVVALYFVLLKWGKSIRYRANFIAVCVICGALGYVYLIKSGLLLQLASFLSLNTMGRLGYYAQASEFFEFSPLFLGKGFTYFSKYWGGLRESGFRIDGIVVAGSIHSDLLVFYIENGFIGTIVFILYSFNSKTLRMQKLYGGKVAEIYLLLTSYIFVLYLTDNTFTYPGVQCLYFAVPLVLSSSIFHKNSKLLKYEEVKHNTKDNYREKLISG